jgi:uncharacterized protein (TIGR02246 family)
MRHYRIRAGLFLAVFACTFAGATQSKPSDRAAGQDDLKAFLEAKVRAEWDALKKKDKKAYGDLLAEDYEGVEIDGKGERSKTQAINEVVEGNVFNYTLVPVKVSVLSPDTAFVIYEVTMQFPPKSVVRFSRIYISELWVKRNGQWKELHYQETHVK